MGQEERKQKRISDTPSSLVSHGSTVVSRTRLASERG